jgi:hypothetical protein
MQISQRLSVICYHGFSGHSPLKSQMSQNSRCHYIKFVITTPDYTINSLTFMNSPWFPCMIPRTLNGTGHFQNAIVNLVSFSYPILKRGETEGGDGGG